MPCNAARTNQNDATLLRLRIAALSDSPTPFVPNSERGVQARHQRHPVVLSIIGRRGPLGSAVAVLLDVFIYWNSSRNFLERRSEEHTSELQSLMRNSYAVFCLNQKT